MDYNALMEKWDGLFEQMPQHLAKNALYATFVYIKKGELPKNSTLYYILYGIMSDIDLMKHETNLNEDFSENSAEKSRDSSPSAKKENKNENQKDKEIEKEKKRKKEKNQKKKRIIKEKDKEKEKTKEKNKEKNPPPLSSSFLECADDASHSGGGGGRNFEVVLENSSDIEIEETNHCNMSQEQWNLVDAERFKTYFNALQSRYGRSYTLQIVLGRRLKQLCLLVSEFGKEIICKAFEIAAKSDFINGNNKFHRHLGFDWILCRDNFIKVLEGYYDNPRGVPCPEAALRMERARRKVEEEQEQAAPQNYTSYEEYLETKARAEAGDTTAAQLLLPPELRKNLQLSTL